jgi:hypothetical protein
MVEGLADVRCVEVYHLSAPSQPTCFSHRWRTYGVALHLQFVSNFDLSSQLLLTRYYLPLASIHCDPIPGPESVANVWRILFQVGQSGRAN